MFDYEGPPRRVTVTFSHSARSWLAMEALRHQVTESELLRRIVDEVRGFTIVQRDAAPVPTDRGSAARK